MHQKSVIKDEIKIFESVCDKGICSGLSSNLCDNISASLFKEILEELSEKMSICPQDARNTCHIKSSKLQYIEDLMITRCYEACKLCISLATQEIPRQRIAFL